MTSSAAVKRTTQVTKRDIPLGKPSECIHTTESNRLHLPPAFPCEAPLTNQHVFPPKCGSSCRHLTNVAGPIELLFKERTEEKNLCRTGDVTFGDLGSALDCCARGRKFESPVRQRFFLFVFSLKRSSIGPATYTLQECLQKWRLDFNVNLLSRTKSYVHHHLRQSTGNSISSRVSMCERILLDILTRLEILFAGDFW